MDQSYSTSRAFQYQVRGGFEMLNMFDQIHKGKLKEDGLRTIHSNCEVITSFNWFAGTLTKRLETVYTSKGHSNVCFLSFYRLAYWRVTVRRRGMASSIVTDFEDDDRASIG